MSERTTIGGTVYEAIGSSSSNLLLKCNGIARIQWGNKLIDLIKDGKIASGDSLELIFIVNDESLINSDGIYVLTTEESDQLWVYKDGNKYDLTKTDLYISANEELNLTVEQKKLALDNIGMYYDTFVEVQNAGIKNGIVYVVENKTLYTIKDGVIEEFEAKLKTVTVKEQESEEVEKINSSIKIVLSILDEEYLILADLRITANYSIYVKNSAQIGSESADKTKGYRLYIEGDTSYLDVDKINVRHGFDIKLYLEITFSELSEKILNSNLESHKWYLITDYLNPWKLIANDVLFNRPILVRALTSNTLYDFGYLFKDHRVKIKYDPFYKESITYKQTVNDLTTEVVIYTRGLITWMKDSNNNEANFDFLDYTDYQKLELAKLHYPGDDETLDKSIFPKYSHDNKLIVYDLKGTIIKNSVIDDTNTNIIDFQFDDSGENSMKFHNNIIECRGLILKPECSNFYNNNLHESSKLEISNSFCNNLFKTIYSTIDLSTLTYNDFSKIENNEIFNTITFTDIIENVKCNKFINCAFNKSLTNCIFGTVSLCTFSGKITDSNIENIDAFVNIYGNIEKSTIKEIVNNITIKGNIINSVIDKISNNTIIDSIFDNVKFKNLSNCTFAEGTINNVVSFVDLNEAFDSTNYNLLYNFNKQKEIYINKGIVLVICIPEVVFHRGMIIMHSGIEDIPEGWAICDGGEYEWNGKKSKTPDLTNRFIKAVATVSEIREINNKDINDKGELQLKEEHLPKHSHPHIKHTHTFSGSDSSTVSDSFTALTDNSMLNAVTEVEEGTLGYSGDSTTKSTVTVSDTVSITISGDTSEVASIEEEKTWENKPIKVIPNYYSLIFIMKL